MKKYLRIIALILTLAISVSAFVGCNGSEDEPETSGSDEESKSVEETTDEYFPEIEKKNYGKEFYFSIMDDVNDSQYYWVKETNNNTMSDAVYNRQENVRKYLGVEILASITENEGRYVEPFQNAVKSKEDSVHLLLTHVYYGMDSFITGSYLTDFQDIPQFNLDQDYWNYQFMDDISVNGHMYLGFNDINILNTTVITFNKELLARYEDKLDESVYDMVENYRWTLDKMIWLASIAYVDHNADGKTKDDQFGISGYQSVPFCGFMQASNINLVEMNEKGAYVVSCYNEKNKQKMSDLVDKLYNLANSDYALLVPNAYPEANMVSGRTLMEISGTFWLPGYLNYEVEFGVLPFPMYNEDQKNVGYRSLQWGGYLCVPSYLGDPTMVYETIEMMAYYSDPVNIAFYEKLLGKKVAEAPLDRKMLDIVWDSVCSDFGQTYYSVVLSTGLLYMLPNLTKTNRTQNLASYMASVETSANKSFKRFVSKVK